MEREQERLDIKKGKETKQQQERNRIEERKKNIREQRKLKKHTIEAKVTRGERKSGARIGKQRKLRIDIGNG